MRRRRDRRGGVTGGADTGHQANLSATRRDPLQHAVIVVMGVSGAGKTTIGRALADKLTVQFVDADDLHPLSNKRKMEAGKPLTDDDRAPWLEKVARVIEAARGSGIVVACSALKRHYRAILAAHTPELVFVHLAGARDLIGRRQADRVHEFMPTSLVASQFATLEPLAADEQGFPVDIAMPPARIVEAIVEGLCERRTG